MHAVVSNQGMMWPSLTLLLHCSKQDHAIACLRQLNNNPTVFTVERRPIVEFAIDNVKVLVAELLLQTLPCVIIHNILANHRCSAVHE